MKRFSILMGAAFVAFAVLSQTGTGAVNLTMAEKFAGAPATGPSGVYSFDKDHTAIGFKVRHNSLIDIPGYFRDFTGTINYDSADVGKSTVEFTAKATSVDTGVVRRDNHLRSKDFFEVDKFADVTFKSTKVEKKGNNWLVTGDFTMKGVTKSITFPFNIAGINPATERGGARMGVTGLTTINRRDYGIIYGAAATIADEVHVDLQIEATMPRPTTAAPTPKTE
jgi:polyisoprenoid-binding protein YceI